MKHNKLIHSNKLKHITISIIFIFLLLILHTFIKLSDDDIKIANKLINYSSPFAFSKAMYLSWEGSWFCQFIVAAVLSFPISFYVINIFMCLLCAYSLVELLPGEYSFEKELLAITLFLMYPLGSVSTAGWCDTSIVYLWVVSCALYGLTISKKLYQSKIVSTPLFIISLLALAYGSNREQSGLMLFIILGLLSCAQLANKHMISFKLLTQFIIVCISWASVMLSPGVKCKNEVYENLYPEFINMNFFEKLFHVLVDTLNYFINEFHWIVLFLLLLVAFLAFVKETTIIEKAICIYPLFYSIGAYISTYFFSNKFFGMSQYFTSHNANDKKIYVTFLLQMIWVGCLLASLYIHAASQHDFILLITILIAGISTRLGTAVSSAIKMSGTRQCIFFYFALIFLTGYLVVRNDLHKRRTTLYIFSIAGLLSLASLINALIIYGGNIPHYIDRYHLFLK